MTVGPSVFYLTNNLLEADNALKELQEDDDIARDTWMSRRLATGTRTRKPKGGANEAPESTVDLYVKEKSSEAASQEKVSHGPFTYLTLVTDGLFFQQGTVIDKTLRDNQRAESLRQLQQREAQLQR